MPDNVNTATAGPAGNIVMIFYLAALVPVLIGIAPPEMIVLLIPMGLAGVLVQLVAGTLELKRGDVMGGNITLAFSAFMVYGSVGTLLKLLNIGPQNTATVDGFIFLSMGIVLITVTGLALRACFAAALFLVITDIFFVLLGLSNLLGMPSLSVAAGYIELLAIFSLFWQVAAAILNTAYGKEVISLGAPLIKSAPEEAGANA